MKANTDGPAAGVGVRARAIRRAKGLTQGEIARRSGFSDAYVSKIERASTAVPPLHTLLRLARALQVEPEELAGQSVNGDLAVPEATGREEILSAATELFSTKGYSRVSIRELAARAGCSTANLYHHFASKYEIFVSLIEGAMHWHLAGLAGALERYENPIDQLRHVFRNHLFLNMTRREVGLLTDDFHPITGADLDRFIGERDEYERGVRAIVQRGVREGALAVEDPTIAVRAALDACNSVYLWFRPEGPLGAEEVADRIVEFLLAGLGAGSASTREGTA